MKRRTPTLDQGQLLDAVPVQNLAVKPQRNDRGALVLYAPLRRPWYWRGPIAWLAPTHGRRGVELDRLGEEVWQACDGQQRTEQIVESFALRHHLRFHEARVSVQQFLREMTRRGLVAIVVR